MRSVHVAAAAMAPFSMAGEQGPAELSAEVLRETIRSAGIEPGAVEALYGGTVYGGSLLAQRAGQQVGVTGIPALTVENACASGGTAVHIGRQAIASGSRDCVLAFGADCLSLLGGGTLPLDLADPEAALGMVMPAAYAMRAQRYLHEHGASVEDLARVSVLNRGNGATNPRAVFQKPVSVEQVLDSRPIATPLTLLQCCPNADGAAAVLLCTEDFAQSLDRPSVEIRASVITSGRVAGRPGDSTWADITARAAAAAYEEAGVGPRDLDLVELHDAFTIGELLHTEALGLAERGGAYRALAEGKFARDGEVSVNPSGGLLSRGHPLGASGVAQIAETYWQLTGAAGPLQVDGAELALTHVTGGGISGVDNAACSVHILAAAG